MTNEGTASIGWVDAVQAVRLDRLLLALTLVAGLLLGSGITLLALERERSRAASERPALAVKTWPHRALDREWRGTRTPVDVDRMFRSR